MGKKEVKNNLNQAMFEMFGVGKDPANQEETKPEPEIVTAPEVPVEPKAEVEAAVQEETKMNQPVQQIKNEKTYLAAGTSMEGILKTKGDVEIAGDFKGDVVSEGNVILHSSFNGNITAGSLTVLDTTLCGDVRVSGSVQINEGSVINGNIFAQSVTCSGKVVGDMEVQGDLVLGQSAKVEGSITTKTMSMARGAVMKGNLVMAV